MTAIIELNSLDTVAEHSTKHCATVSPSFIISRFKLLLITAQHSIYKFTMLKPGCATIGGTIAEPGAVAPGAPGAPGAPPA